MHNFCIKISKIFSEGGIAPFPDPTLYPSAPYSKFLDPPLVTAVCEVSLKHFSFMSFWMTSDTKT